MQNLFPQKAGAKNEWLKRKLEKSTILFTEDDIFEIILFIKKEKIKYIK